MRRLVVLFCLFLLCIQEIYAQQQVSDELRAYNDYLLNLSCYKASGELNMAIGEKFMEGDIAGVRRLSAEREKLLMQSIDSVLAFRADAKKVKRRHSWLPGWYLIWDLKIPEKY